MVHNWKARQIHKFFYIGTINFQTIKRMICLYDQGRDILKQNFDK